MKQKSTQNSVQTSLRCSAIFFLLFSLCSIAATAHTVTYYIPPCLSAGQQAVIAAKVTFCNSSTWFHWQYRVNNAAPGAWTFLSNGSNTINGTAFTVSNANGKSNVADSCASLKINSSTTALNNVEFRVLMGDNADPQVVTTPVWGGDDQALFEVKNVRITIRPSTESCFTGCTDNVLVLTPPATLNTPMTDFYGGFESGSSNFGGTNANGSSITAQTDITQWTGGALGTSPRYRAANNADTVNSAFTAFAPHSGRQMLIVSRSNSSSNKIWYKTIVAPTSPEQKYYVNTGTFKVWAAKADGGANPTLVLEIIGTNIANATVVLATTTFVFTTQAAGQWVQITVADIGIAPNTYKKIEYRIRNTNTTANSFVLDDICLLTPQPSPPSTPVVLAALQGSYTNGTAKLNWGTQQESNSSHFEIERSSDGASFSSIGRVAAAGNSSRELAYKFDDIKVNAGTNYYRLKMVDKDGSFAYSNTIVLNVTIKGTFITGVYPAPFTSRINVTIAAENTSQVVLRLVDNTGKQLAQQTNILRKGVNNLILSGLDGLAKGFYIMEVLTDGKKESRKLVK
jgi:Secretion system C-terminal sorting domain